VTTDRTVALVRAAILEALDGKPWLFWDEDEDLANAQRVDFADRVAAWMTREFPSSAEGTERQTPMPVSRYFARGAGMGFNGVELVAHKDGDLVHYGDYKALEDLYCAQSAIPPTPRQSMLMHCGWCGMSTTHDIVTVVGVDYARCRNCGVKFTHSSDRCAE
jgi:hypothetical protein